MREKKYALFVAGSSWLLDLSGLSGGTAFLHPIQRDRPGEGSTHSPFHHCFGKAAAGYVLENGLAESIDMVHLKSKLIERGSSELIRSACSSPLRKREEGIQLPWSSPRASALKKEVYEANCCCQNKATWSIRSERSMGHVISPWPAYVMIISHVNRLDYPSLRLNDYGKQNRADKFGLERVRSMQ
jgi:hypothetical protein